MDEHVNNNYLYLVDEDAREWVISTFEESFNLGFIMQHLITALMIKLDLPNGFSDFSDEEINDISQQAGYYATSYESFDFLPIFKDVINNFFKKHFLGDLFEKMNLNLIKSISKKKVSKDKNITQLSGLKISKNHLVL
ncbi:MAG: hypothetical protein HN978_21185 [Desulfobacula sp.]|uniref:hypothetical protein n=1 Tax=Desulfobacula sp. TaxID=2593537 RepID=UPI001E186107|nr:hypothetical protein [Desulfobacula sp.]